ncbi:MAG: hypothetical protein EBQ96_09385 [Proteobacteria bacterium]|nr:hypothetical protein [Pseudomonadota bacterium]
MRTDDFDEIQPQDTSDGIPDVVQSEQIQDSFDEFDNPPENKDGGKSLGSLLRDNPFIKIALVAVGIVAVIVAFVMFGGSKENEKSDVGVAVKEREAPGQETSESYREAVNEVNQQRLETALQTGDSTMPIPTATPEIPNTTPAPEEPPVNLDDPLADWRASAQNTGPQQPAQPTAPEPVIGGSQYPVTAPTAQGPDPAAVDALAQAMSSQMNSILQKHEITGPQIIQVTNIDKYLEPANAEGGDNPNTEPKEVEILVPAGTIVYAQTLTEANTDAPGPVLARISNGPLKGNKIIGTFDKNEEFLTLNFNTVVVKGVSQSVNAVALDPKTTLPAVATEVDHRYLRRFVLPAAARFIQGMGDAIAQREQTVTVNNGTTTSSQADLKPREELAAGLAEGTQELADQLDQMGEDTKVMIKVHAGTPIGILFLEPVTKENN